jgi:hypothetical protein
MAWSQRLFNYGEHLRTSGLQLEADFGWRNAQWFGLCSELKKKSQQPGKPTTGVISGGAGGIRTHGTLRFNWFRVLFALGISVSAVVGDGSFGNGESPCAATDFGRADRYWPAPYQKKPEFKLKWEMPQNDQLFARWQENTQEESPCPVWLCERPPG